MYPVTKDIRRLEIRLGVPEQTERVVRPMLLQEELLQAENLDRKDKWYCLGRRAQDIVLSCLALLVLWPAMLVVALIIVIDSPGGAPIFAQTRVGKNGKEFTFYKFRSMIPQAEAQLEVLLPRNEMDGPVFKIKEDPRITRFGRFIRMTSIDELPQLLNVLRGDMSIVGPRPALPREVEQYGPYERQRLLVKPGLTCLWQIRANRNEIGFQDWVAMDVDYIRRRSFWLDWRIIFATFGAVIKMRGV